MNYERIEQTLLQRDGLINTKALFYMYGHIHNEIFKQCYLWEFEKGNIEVEIKRLCDIQYPERIMILIRSYIYKLVDRKNDYRKGWKMIVILLNYLKTENAISTIYKNALGRLIGKDYYSEKIKLIIREIQNVKRQNERAAKT